MSALCPQPCRDHCQRTAVGDEALAIRDLEQAASRLTKSRKPDSFVIRRKRSASRHRRRPAGLSCALSLAQKKYGVTVFDKAPGWGGALRGHPDFETFDEDFNMQFSAVEAEFRYNSEITSLDGLGDYQAVYIATGKGGSDFCLKAGCDPELLSTERTGVFMGGEVCGARLWKLSPRAGGLQGHRTLSADGQSVKTNDAFDRTNATVSPPRRC